MWPLSNFLKSFRVNDGDPNVCRAQLAAVAGHIPHIYGLITVCTYALAWTFWGHAPLILVLTLPVLMTVLAAIRVSAYFRSPEDQLSDGQVAKWLQTSIWICGGHSLSTTIWALALFPYGDAYARGHVAFFIGVIVTSAVFCLKQLRPAATLWLIGSMVPCAIYFSFAGLPAFNAIAVNLIVVALILYSVTRDFGSDFEYLIRDKTRMEEQQAETQALSDANYKLANLDSLTELPNRRSFFSQLDTRMIGALDGEADPLAVGIIDLDGFKAVNDIYGHAVGDRLLVEVGQRFEKILSDDLFVARLGGDEFGLIVSNTVTDLELGLIGERVRTILDEPFIIDEVTARVGASVGFAVYPTAAYSAKTLFERADYALYHAKTNSPGETVLFSEEHEKQIRDIHGLERHLRDADFEEELSLVFQPIVNTKAGHVRGVEALARWDSPAGGRVPPDKFIAVAEKAGIINQITKVLLAKALRAAMHWPNNVFLSFNLSAHDIGTTQCVDELVEIVRNSGFPTERLCFEITETAVMQDSERATEALLKLHKMGIQIALDDFGTGQSSLSAVRSLPLDRVKIDRSFVVELESDKSARAVMQTVIDLCHNLELQCIVEGVETEAQLEALREMRCYHIQGYLFARPMSAEDMDRFLAADSNLKALSA